MTVRFKADPASSLPDPSLLIGMELNRDLYTNQVQFFGADPLGYYALTQRRLTKYIKGDFLETSKPNVVCFAMVGVATGSFRLPEIESSTLQANIDEELRTTLMNTLKIVEENLDNYSENSDVFYEFNSIFMKHGEGSIHCLQDLITGNEIDSIFAGRLLRHLGYMASDFRSKLITWLLEYFLISKKIPIRNGAVLGLANLNNPETVPSIEKALAAEQIPEIKRNIQRTLKRLIKRVNG